MLSSAYEQLKLSMTLHRADMAGHVKICTSVANWQKFRPQNTKVSPQKSQRPEKSAAEFLADFNKNGRKVAELFLNCVIDIKAFIIGRNRLSNTLMNSTVCYYYG
jgi:hypothetical protein